MKKIVILFAALIVSVAAFSQEKTYTAPDFKKIKKAVKSKKSEMYYPKLVQRFIDVDSTMTYEQVYNLYYGAVTQSLYDPYGYFDADKQLDELFEGRDWTKSDLEKGLNIVNKQLEKSPASLYFTLYKFRIYQKLYGEESEEANRVSNQLGDVLTAILSTGNGLSMKTATYVLYICDEYAIMNLVGVKRTEQELVHEGKRSFDVLTIDENEYGLEKLYYDVSVMMDYLDKVLK